MELRFLRDVAKREVDFIVLKDGKAQLAVECKSGERNVSPHLRYFSERIEVPQFYQFHMGKKHYQKENIEVIPFIKFCQQIEIP